MQNDFTDNIVLYLSLEKMRPLTEDESKMIFTKLANYIVCSCLFPPIVGVLTQS